MPCQTGKPLSVRRRTVSDKAIRTQASLSRLLNGSVLLSCERLTG
jgi:hypothetical protein